MPTSIRSCATTRPLVGLPVEPRVKVSAPTAVLEFDTRDNLFTPTEGVYAETSYLASREALGASKDFERFEQIVMGWLPLPHRITVGARANYAWSSNGTPFFLRPYIPLRGVPAMRYQGDRMGSVEVEARWPVSGRWSGVVFGGAGTARTERDAFDATQNVGSGGSACATRWRASSGWMSASTSPAARGRRRCISSWATPGSGPDAGHVVRRARQIGPSGITLGAPSPDPGLWRGSYGAARAGLS